MSEFIAEMMPRQSTVKYNYEDDMDSDSEDFIADLRPRGHSNRSQSDCHFAEKPLCQKDSPSDNDILRMLSDQKFTRERLASLLNDSILDLIEKILTGRDVASIQGEVVIAFHEKEDEKPFTLNLHRSFRPAPSLHPSYSNDIFGLNLRFKDVPKVTVDEAEWQLSSGICEDMTQEVPGLLKNEMPHVLSDQRLSPSRYSDNESGYMSRDGDDRDRLSPASISSVETVKQLSPRALSPLSDFHCSSRMDSLFDEDFRQKVETSCEKSPAEGRKSVSELSDANSTGDDEDDFDDSDENSPLVIDETKLETTSDIPSETNNGSAHISKECDDNSSLSEGNESTKTKTSEANGTDAMISEVKSNMGGMETESPMDLSGDSKKLWEKVSSTQTLDLKSRYFPRDLSFTLQAQNSRTNNVSKNEGKILELSYHGQSTEEDDDSEQGHLLDLTVKKADSEKRSEDDGSCDPRWRKSPGSSSIVSRNGYAPEIPHPRSDFETVANDFRSTTKLFRHVYKVQNDSRHNPTFTIQEKNVPEVLKVPSLENTVSQPIRPKSLENWPQVNKCDSVPFLSRSVSSNLDAIPTSGPLRFNPYSREKLADIAAKYMASRTNDTKDINSANQKFNKLREKLALSAIHKMRQQKCSRTLKTIDHNRKTAVHGADSSLQSKLDAENQLRVDTNSETTLMTHLPVFIKSENLQDEESPVATSCCSHVSSTGSHKDHKCSVAHKCNKSSSMDFSSKFRVCEFCKEEFNSFHDLEGHSVTVHKRYLCEHCGKSFTARPNRDRHVRFHTGERPYKCDLCNSDFTRGDDLKYHRTTRHPDAQPFVCTRCNATFTWQRDLERHVRHSKCKI